MTILTALACLQLAVDASHETTTATITAPPAVGAPIIADEGNPRRNATKEFGGAVLRGELAAGRPLLASVGRTPVLVARNREVRIEYVKGALSITAEGRSLSNGAEGDTVRVMNLGSRTIVTGVVVDAGRVVVQ